MKKMIECTGCGKRFPADLSECPGCHEPYDPSLIPFSPSGSPAPLARTMTGCEPTDPDEREPEIIQWNDPTHETLLHRIPHVEDIPRYSVLLVSPGQRAAVEEGGRVEILKPGTYALFQEEHFRSEIIGLLNQEEGLSAVTRLGIGRRILLFSEQKHLLRFDVLQSFQGGEPWQARIPVRASMRLAGEKAEKLLDFAVDLTSDMEASEALKSLVVDEVSSRLSRALAPYTAYHELRELHEESAFRAWLIRILDGKLCHGVTAEANELLSARCGIELTEDISLYEPELRVTRNAVSVNCPRCGCQNSLAPEEFRAAFRCRRCQTWLSYCPSCGQYVTTDRLDKVCDRCGRRIYADRGKQGRN